MRRGSLVGPALIIIIGALFMMNTLRPDLPLLEIGARYWPFLLIAWGLLRLLEVLSWAARSRPLPSSGLSGGEWFMVVLICLVGSGLYAANRFRPWQHLGILAEKRIEVFGKTYDFAVPDHREPVGKGPRVLIENLNGSVRVVGADSQEVTVTGRKSIQALQESDAGAADRQSPVEVSVQGDQVVVRTNQDRVTGEQRVSTDLELTVPRGASLEGRGRNGDFEISDLNGDVEISSDNAGVRVQNVRGSVRLDLRRSDLVRAVKVQGSVELNGAHGRDLELEEVGGEVVINGSYSGDLQFRNIARPIRLQGSRTELRVEKLPGQIHMDLSGLAGTKLVGPIRFSSRSRDVELEDFSGSLEVAIDRGDVSLRPVVVPLSRIDVRTRSGQVDLALPESARFQLKAVTNRGDVSNDYGDVLVRSGAGAGPRHHGASLEGGAGGPSLSLVTDRGSITVRKDTPVSAARAAALDGPIHQ